MELRYSDPIILDRAEVRMTADYVRDVELAIVPARMKI
jgi:hypothetical protein